ncbi:MAG: hypothetical protein OJF49_003241 [Ktedonobacterales bacterium]|jgi:uncharacterized protein YjbI with pentapeptide repeats|nr:MAG: hypothetical protein OJF49_003241 [Ktedonobacterales bacterium]
MTDASQPDTTSPADQSPSLTIFSTTSENQPGLDSWGDPISDARLAELRDLTERQRAWAAQPDGERHVDSSVFTGVHLTGADVFWLAALAVAGPESDLDTLATRLRLHDYGHFPLSDLHLEGAVLQGAHLVDSFLSEAHLERADLSEAYLTGANLSRAYLDEAKVSKALLNRATLIEAHLERADLSNATLEHVYLNDAHLERANLSGAHLKESELKRVHLEGATLDGADLSEALLWDAFLTGADLHEADLHKARLEQVNLTGTHLERANLRAALLDGTILTEAHLEEADLNDAHLERTDLNRAHLERASLNDAHLERASLREAHLDGASLDSAYLEEADLSQAHLEEADLYQAHLERAYLSGAHLDRANLRTTHLDAAHLDDAHLDGADLRAAHLEGANLQQAHLEGANLQQAHLEGTILNDAHLADADLGVASLDKTTRLNGAILTRVRLDQATFDNTNLSVVDWDLVPVLGDEHIARVALDKDQKRKSRAIRATECAAAARAYRLLATKLKDQGLGDIADRYAYRAQVMQRKQRWYERRFGSYLASGFLSLLVGYGYRLHRILITYVLTVALFAALFWLAGSLGGPGANALRPDQAAQISLNAIHGRVFFAQFGLDTVQSWIATAESIAGIVIESLFVAVLLQRLFSR